VAAGAGLGDHGGVEIETASRKIVLFQEAKEFAAAAADIENSAAGDDGGGGAEDRQIAFGAAGDLVGGAAKAVFEGDIQRVEAGGFDGVDIFLRRGGKIFACICNE